MRQISKGITAARVSKVYAALFAVLFGWLTSVQSSSAGEIPIGMPINEATAHTDVEWEYPIIINDVKLRLPKSPFISVSTPDTAYDAMGVKTSRAIRMVLDESNISLLGPENPGTVDDVYRRKAVQVLVYGWPHKHILPMMAQNSLKIFQSTDGQKFGKYFKVGKLPNEWKQYIYADGIKQVWGGCRPKSYIGITGCDVWAMDDDRILITTFIAVYPNEDVGTELDKAYILIQSLLETLESWKG